MKHFIGEGNLLLERQEKRFDIPNKKVSELVEKILATKKYSKEKFFKKYDSAIVLNTEYDVPYAKDMNYFARPNYTGARLRTYLSPDKEEVSYTWGEWKTKEDNKVTKTRECLKTVSQHDNFVAGVLNQGLVLVCHLRYERSALNSKDGKIRITFDKDSRYYAPDGWKEITNLTKTKVGFTKMKVKYVGKEPINVFKLTKKVLK